MASRVDLNGIKTAIRSTLLAANTTTASPIDLSSGLSNSVRVQNILKINPEMIIPQASMFPLVTCYVTEKPIKSMDIASTQLDAKRRATVNVNIVGTIWNNNFNSINEDPADEDINYLMENIELVLRSDYNLGGKVNWQLASDCKYYTTILDEQTHLRSGVLQVNCEVFY
jgi:hypothetical protein